MAIVSFSNQSHECTVTAAVPGGSSVRFTMRRRVAEDGDHYNANAAKTNHFILSIAR